ncbi:hypothetical protein ACFL5V_03460 [Fibrobacterota bacterium]
MDYLESERKSRQNYKQKRNKGGTSSNRLIIFTSFLSKIIDPFSALFSFFIHGNEY